MEIKWEINNPQEALGLALTTITAIASLVMGVKTQESFLYLNAISAVLVTPLVLYVLRHKPSYPPPSF